MAGIVAVVVAAVLTVAPWTIRNFAVMDTIVPVSNVDSFVLAGVYNDQAAETDSPFTAAFRPPDGVPEMRGFFNDRRIDETTLSLRLRDAAFDYLGDHPTYLAEVVAWNTVRMFELTGFDVTRAVYRDEFSYSRSWADTAVVAWWVLALLALARRVRPTAPPDRSRLLAHPVAGLGVDRATERECPVAHPDRAIRNSPRGHRDRRLPRPMVAGRAAQRSRRSLTSLRARSVAASRPYRKA